MINYVNAIDGIGERNGTNLKDRARRMGRKDDEMKDKDDLTNHI